MKTKFSLRLAMLLSLLGFLLGIPRVTTLVYAQDTGQNHEILFSIPVGDEGIHYSGTEHPDMLVWGPAAITVAPDGNFWIADTAGNQLLQYDPEGTLLNKISIEDLVVGAGDIEVTSKGIWVLDEASEPPKVVHVGLDGKNPRAYELPKGLRREDGLSGIALGGGNQILVELKGGSKVIRFLTSDGKVNPQPVAGYLYDGKVYKAQPADLKSKNVSRGLITAGDKPIEVTVTHELGGLRLLGRHTDSSVFVLLEELVVDRALRVDQTVRHYDAAGGLVGVARIPISDQYTTVSHGLAIGTDGATYALITKPDHAEIQRLRFSEEISSILPTSPMIDANENILPGGESVLACRSRDTMISTASGYTGNYRNLNNTNINGSCTNRTKPHYLGSAGNYWSVSYDWDGFDTVSGWNNYMTNNYQAGDIDTTGNEGCSRGVDCSGFVSQVWGLTSKYGTCSLDTISTQLSSTSQLLKGDIMNRCSPTPRHTILFSSFASNGMYGYESTTYNNYDRVVNIYRAWSGISNYVPRRYTNVCP
jgi:hypothetical protein